MGSHHIHSQGIGIRIGGVGVAEDFVDRSFIQVFAPVIDVGPDTFQVVPLVPEERSHIQFHLRKEFLNGGAALKELLRAHLLILQALKSGYEGTSVIL